MKVKLTFKEEMLGTTSANPELHREYIQSKNPNGIAEDEDVVVDPDEELKKVTTIFPKDKGVPFVFDYMIRGFFKDAQGALNRIPGEKLTAHKKIIDGLIFVKERKIPIKMPKGSEITICTRPLRANTPQGPIVSLVSSEAIPAGSTIEFTVQVLDEKLLKQVKEWFDYGIFKGLGQWRNSGKGKFVWEEVTTKTPAKKLTKKPVKKPAKKSARKK